MFRNILIALGLFCAIALLAVYLARSTAEPVLPPRQAPPPPASLPIALTPPGDFLPRRTLPPVTLQTDLPSVTLRYYHIQDPALLLRLYRGTAQETLNPVGLARLLSANATPLTTVTQNLRNGEALIDWQTPSPLGNVPGLYVVTVAKDLAGPALAASWFLRTDLLVTAVEGRDEWKVVSQHLLTGKPVADVSLQWYGMGDQPLLAAAQSAADGLDTLAKDKLPPGTVPQLLVGSDSQGHVAFVPLRAVRLPADDSGALRRFLFTDRHQYRAGQTVIVWGYGFADKPEAVTAVLQRPDGLPLTEKALQGVAGAAGWQRFTLPDPAPAGEWQIAATAADGVRHTVSFTVGAPETPRWQSRIKLLGQDGRKLTLAVTLQDKTGQDKSGRGRADWSARLVLRWQAVRQLPDTAADFAFGGYDAPDYPEQDLAALVLTGGTTTVTVTLPEPPDPRTPVAAQLQLVAADAPQAGEIVPLTVPLAPEPFALGIKPLFAAEELRGDGKADFKIGLFRTGAEDQPAPELQYALMAERRSFRWYFADGAWDYKSDTATVPVLGGAVRLDGKGRGLVRVPVRRGQYRLDVFDAARRLQSSWRFQVEAPTPVPPAGALAVVANHDADGVHVGLPALPTPSAVLAVDTQIRALKPRLAAAGVGETLAVTMPQGGYVLGWSPQTLPDGLWQLSHGIAWVPPRPALDEKAVAMLLTHELQAGQAATIAVRLPPGGARGRTAQLVAVPLREETEEQAVAALLAPLAKPRVLQANLAANIPTRWPEVANNPAFTAEQAGGDSAVSDTVAVPDSGSFDLTLPLPDKARQIALHLLVWDKDTIAEVRRVRAVLPLPAAAQPPASVVETLPVITSAGHWDCKPPVKQGGAGAALPNGTPLILAPFAVPDLAGMLGQLYAAETTRSDVLARSLLAARDYEALAAARGVTAAQRLAWQRRVATALLARQRGDGGIALYDDGASDLTASAFALLAWPLFPAGLQDAPRENALLEFLQRRLDRAWGAEAELYARSDAFYALSTRGKINPATLRYFVEKYGNTIRHGVFEAELAVALQSIGDKEASRGFAERALAQLPSLRAEQPQTALQIMEILVLHELAAPAMLVTRLPEMARLRFAAATLAAVTGARLWPKLAAGQPAWQVSWGGQILAESGLAYRAADVKNPLRQIGGQGSAVMVCADYGGVTPLPRATPQLQRSFFTMNGQAVRADRLVAGGSYVVTLTVPEMSAGPGEFMLPLPTGLQLRAIVPGGAVAGALAWLKQVDAVVAQKATPRGVILAVSRPQAGPLRIALVMGVAGRGKLTWPSARLAQFNTTHESSVQQLIIE